MVDFNKLKSLGTELLGKAGEIAGQAKEKAGPLAEQAKEKAGPMASKAKDAAAKGFDKAAETIDSRTGGKYSDKIDSVSHKVDSALGQDKADEAADAVKSTVDSASDSFSHAADAAGDKIADAGSAVSDKAEDFKPTSDSNPA